jgi:hypothetical protein
MDVPLKHVIGTVALIGLIIAVGLTYTTITSYIEADVTKKQLEQIAEYVSLNLVEIINLVDFSNYQTAKMNKTLKLPSDLSGKAYLIKLVNETEGEEGYYVYVQLVTQQDVYARSHIPLNSTKTRLKFLTNIIVYGGTQEIRNAEGQIIGFRQVFVWAEMRSLDEIVAGIDTWNSMGGS